jgi:uncharacterized membrane protein
MNVPIWIWYIIGGTVILFVLANVVGGILGYRRFRRVERDFDEQRERVRKEIRRT